MAMITNAPKSTFAHMARPFAVFDIDGTIFRSSLYLEIIYKLADNGVIKLPEDKSHERALEAWRSRSHSRSYEDYRDKLVQLYEPQVKGMKVADFEKAANEVVNEQVRYTYVYTRKLIKDLIDQGYFMIALSGSQIELVAEFASHWGFEEWIGEEHQRRGAVFTGKTFRTFQEKGKLLKTLVEKHHLTYSRSIGVGDSMGDKEMLEMVDMAIAFNPEHELAILAQEKGWKIVVERKNVAFIMERTDGYYRLVATD